MNTASEAGLRGITTGAAYTASKHGVVGLTKNLAVMTLSHPGPRRRGGRGRTGAAESDTGLGGGCHTFR